MNTRKINKQIAFLKAFRDMNQDMNLTMVISFLELAKDQGITGRDLEAALDIPSATAARTLRLFDKQQSNGKPGYDMVEARLDPTDYRNKLRHLNAKGKAFLAELDDILSDQ